MIESHIMFDVECLSLRPNAAILSIGAVRFNPKDNDDWKSLEMPSRLFYSAFPLEVQLETGSHICSDTLAWWMQQSPDAQRVFEESSSLHRHSTPDLLAQLYGWMGTTVDGVWACPSHFDYPKILNLFQKNGVIFPCDFWKIHCGMSLKTLVDPDGKQTKIPLPPGFVAHNALEDAQKQVLQVQQCLRLLKS